VSGPVSPLDDRRRSVDQYEDVWRGVLEIVVRVLETGERDLSRVVRLVEAEWRGLSVEPVAGMSFGEIVTLPSAALFGGRRDLLMRLLADACTPRTELVVELGSGCGMNLLNLHLWGGPQVAYWGLEPTASGRECTRRLVELAPDLDLHTRAFDYEAPRYDLPTADNDHVLVFTAHSIEQVTEVPAEVITGLFGLGRSLTGLHFEPIGWQMPGRTSSPAPREYAVRQRYNRNLWPLLSELATAGEIAIDTVVPDLFGDKAKNPSTLVVWHR
jgi:hypothetical protein